MKAMLGGLATSLVALAGCSPVNNDVRVDATGSSIISGFVALCGKETRLGLQGAHLHASVPITCEGSGEVRLKLEDGRTVTCPIGYVAPGADQTFDFKVTESGCVDEIGAQQAIGG